ncbi:unnamed protein product, partial [Medioppia subpectinata]
SARVSTRWRNAVRNVERNEHHFWRRRCQQEIQPSVLETISSYNVLTIDDMDSDKCRDIYVKWYRYQRLKHVDNTCLESYHTFGTKALFVDNITTIAVTGTLVITGHRSGEVKVTDAHNNMAPLVVTRHKDRVNDIAVVNLAGDEIYEYHKIRSDDSDPYPTDYPSFANHHHMITISASNGIEISLIAGRGVGQSFSICPLLERRFMKVRVSRDLLAISDQHSLDITLFRLSLNTKGVVPVGTEALKANFITHVSCEQHFADSNHWLGVFTFNNYQLKSFSHEDTKILCGDIETNNELISSKSDRKWKWSSVNELHYQYVHNRTNGTDYGLVSVKSVFSFGDGIFFIITNHNQILFTNDSKTFIICPFDHYLKTGDNITSIALFGAVVVCGSKDGYLFAHSCPTLKRIHYLTHHEPLLETRITGDRIISVSITDNGVSLMIAAATLTKLYVVNCTPTMASRANSSARSDSVMIENPSPCSSETLALKSLKIED